MICVNNELEFQNWFKENYKQFGFDSISICNNTFPDFIMIQEGKKISLELETYSSNFLLHKHDSKKVNKVLCIIEDIKLGIPTLIAENVKLTEDKNNTAYSMLSLIRRLLQKSPEGLTAADISKKLDITRHTASVALAELKGAQLIRIREVGKAKLNYWGGSK